MKTAEEIDAELATLEDPKQFSLVQEEPIYWSPSRCPRCGAAPLSHQGNSSSSWTRLYRCEACSARIRQDEGDKMGGGFDYFYVYIPA